LLYACIGQILFPETKLKTIFGCLAVSV